MHKIKSHSTVEKIAKKHRLDVSFVERQLNMGIPIEHEHTNDRDLAIDIALQHLDEIPDYYTRLKKMEASAKKQHKKYKDIKEDAVTDLQKGILKLHNTSYKSIDNLMRSIMQKRNMTAKQLHNDFVDKNHQTPDTWAEKNMKEENKDGLWDAIRAKRKRGERPAERGEKDYPKTLKIEEGLKQARKNVGASKCWTGKKVGDPSTKLQDGEEVPNCVSIKEEIEALRYCPKCDKNESAQECKYGEKYWNMYSLPIKLGKKYTPNTPHPGNMPESHDQMKVENIQRGPILSNEKGKRIYPKGQGPKATGATLFPLIKNKTFKEFVIEAKTAAWQRKEGKKKSGGLNRAGVESYRKQHPGSKLKTAVTTEPSELKKGSKSANRRKSFCSRMSGMKKKLTSAKTARDPNSRINKSLRAWNC